MELQKFGNLSENQFRLESTTFGTDHLTAVTRYRKRKIGLCSVGARRKKKKAADWSPAQADFIFRPFFVVGPEFLLGGRKSYLAAEHHNEAAPKKKKSRGFSAWAPKNTT